MTDGESGSEEEDATDDEETTEMEEDDLIDDSSEAEEEEDMTDEQFFEAMFAKARRHHTRKEAKADRIGDALYEYQRVPLGNLGGKWILYSSAFLDCIKRKYQNGSTED